ncbi:hypothetical protein ACE6H2_023211 [Prunus campanulata]
MQQNYQIIAVDLQRWADRPPSSLFRVLVSDGLPYKDRELGDAVGEIKSLRNSERLKEKAVEELTDELNRVDEKLKATDALLESKNLEIKKINDEKKAALAAQFALEATLRRVHATQKDDEMPPIEAIIAPLEAELKLARQEVAKLQDENRALDWLTKSKKAALVEAERTVQIAMEENKILDKLHWQKVAEVEKLTQTVRKLEAAVLAGGAAANAVRDYPRKVQEMNEEKKLLEREVARAKVSANRVATVVANEWKDSSDKVMPGEMQQLRDKLAVAERTAKAEAQLKEKYQLRFKVLEEKFKASNGKSRPSPDARIIGNGPSRSQSLGAAENFCRASSNGYLPRTKLNLQSGFNRSNTATAILKQAKSSSRSFDGGSRLPDRDKLVPDETGKDNTNSASDQTQTDETIGRLEERANGSLAEQSRIEHEDYVSGALYAYGMLQKEVVSLRKAGHEKDQTLKDKDDAIEMLAKKVDTLNKAIEVEPKKMRREVAAMEKEVSAMRVTKEPDQRARRSSAP